MKIGIDGRAAQWYRGTGIGTYTHELIRSLNSVDKINDYLVFLPDCDISHNLNSNFNVKDCLNDISPDKNIIRGLDNISAKINEMLEVVPAPKFEKVKKTA